MYRVSHNTSNGLCSLSTVTSAHTTQYLQGVPVYVQGVHNTRSGLYSLATVTRAYTTQNVVYPVCTQHFMYHLDRKSYQSKAFLI